MHSKAKGEFDWIGLAGSYLRNRILLLHHHHKSPSDELYKPGLTNLLRMVNKRQNIRTIRNNIILILSIDQSEIGKDKYLRCGIGSIDD